MMEDRSAHALDWFGCAVIVLGFFVGSRFDMPQRGLTAIAFPVGVGAFADEIQASFMLPMIMGTADRKVALGPNNLTLRLKPTDRERLLHLPCKETRMPDVGDVTGEETIRVRPIEPIIVRHGTFPTCS